MLSNKQLKYLKSLHQRKYRQKYGNFIAEGVKTAGEIIRQGQSDIEGVFTLPEWLAANESFVAAHEGKVWEVSPNELRAISLLKTPNQVLFVLKQQEQVLVKDELLNGYNLYLDEIRDPGNMGTILRIADWFGVKWVFCSENCVEVFNPKVVQACMGAFLRVKTKSISLLELTSMSPGIPVLGAALNGKPVYETNFHSSGLLVIGNESMGISEVAASLLTEKIMVPRHPDGGAESLNAAVATGIICAFLQGPNKCI